MTQAINTLIDSYPDLEICRHDLNSAFSILKESYSQNGKMLICGNGGSAADSEHIVGELMKGFLSKRPIPESVRQKFKDLFPEEGDYLADHLQGALPAISLVSHSALITAFSNDVTAETVYAQQVYGYGLPGDVLLAISTSGNSANVVRAVQVAKALGLGTIGLTGKKGGKLSELCDVTIKTPRDQTHQVQELHLPVYHALCIALEYTFFNNSQAAPKASDTGVPEMKSSNKTYK